MAAQHLPVYFDKRYWHWFSLYNA